MLTRELDYELPEELIAQKSAVPRDSSRLMVVDAGERTIRHRAFRDLPRFLGPGDTLVVNDTKLVAAGREDHPGPGPAEPAAQDRDGPLDRRRRASCREALGGGALGSGGRRARGATQARTLAA